MRLGMPLWLMRFVTMTEEIKTKIVNTQPRSLSKKMAQRTALDIQAFWLARGHVIHVWVERCGRNTLSRDYGVRSDMKNGLPVKK